MDDQEFKKIVQGVNALLGVDFEMAGEKMCEIVDRGQIRDFERFRHAFLASFPDTAKRKLRAGLFKLLLDTRWQYKEGQPPLLPLECITSEARSGFTRCLVRSGANLMLLSPEFRFTLFMWVAKRCNRTDLAVLWDKMEWIHCEIALAVSLARPNDGPMESVHIRIIRGYIKYWPTVEAQQAGLALCGAYLGGDTVWLKNILAMGYNRNSLCRLKVAELQRHKLSSTALWDLAHVLVETPDSHWPIDTGVLLAHLPHRIALTIEKNAPTLEMIRQYLQSKLPMSLSFLAAKAVVRRIHNRHALSAAALPADCATIPDIVKDMILWCGLPLFYKDVY